MCVNLHLEHMDSDSTDSQMFADFFSIYQTVHTPKIFLEEQ